MKLILVVEDSKFIGSMVKYRLEEAAYDVIWVKKMSEAIKTLDENEHNFFAALLDYNLPDAPRGEIIDEVSKRDIPSIVFTGLVSKEVRETVWTKGVVDYVIKDDPNSLDYLISMLRRIEINENIKVLIVDDSSFFRKALTDLLKIHRYQTLSARNGKEALDVLENHPDIKLVITDFNMPEMDGFTLTRKIREIHSKDDLAIIGISSEGENVMAARFIKSGANDFLIKQSFLTEEFYCRVTQSIENIELIQMIREAAIKDFLTTLYNRRYFFEMGKTLFASAVRDSLTLACAMIDIDHFKDVNDSYGHETGDIALQHIAKILKSRTRQSDIVARVGGEEFCVLAVNMDVNDSQKLFEELRKKVEETPVYIDTEQEIFMTVSIGITTELAASLDEMVNQADTLLYQAKENGRNRVEIAPI